MRLLQLDPETQGYISKGLLSVGHAKVLLGLENAADLSDELSPERITAARQDYARAIQAILNLPPRARAAFQFHRFENMTYGAIAKRMGISKESVKELMHRAIVRIAEQLEQDR